MNSTSLSSSLAENGTDDAPPQTGEEGSSSFPSSASNSKDHTAPTADSMVPLSMRMMRNIYFCCKDCDDDSGAAKARKNFLPDYMLAAANSITADANEPPPSSSSSKVAVAPSKQATIASNDTILSPHTRLRSISATIENLIVNYLACCKLYSCDPNAGVLTALRYSLPTLRVSSNFHDQDMLSLCELLLHHSNHALRHIARLDFTPATKEGRLHGQLGFKSHGAFTLSKVLQKSKFIKEVYLQRNRIGPYGAAALFAACSTNPSVRTLVMRRCLIGERGAKAFAEHVASTNGDKCGLTHVDLSVNRIGMLGTTLIAEALAKRGTDPIEVDLQGNLIFQEVMNCITHGMGIILCIIGTCMLSDRVKHQPTNTIICCAIYSVSLLVLYFSSTLFHSFFALRTTRYIFQVFDHCAIYILIAGSYTPYLGISLAEKHIWSRGLLAFLWLLCFCGVYVEAFLPDWKHKGKFSLTMYLGMGWSCMVCLPDLIEAVPMAAIEWLVWGGVGYTAGVPFYVRNNNLDHSIWHCFVLAGSVFHWFGVYFHVALL